MGMRIRAVDLGNGYAQLVEEFPDLTYFQIVWLGDWNRLVVTEEKGVYFARQIDGKLLRVLNANNTPPIPDQRVIVGREKVSHNRNEWQICRVIEPFR